ncbi:MAG: exodeoxyribonuclease VII large subunit [Acidobacteriota bacterium]
MYDDEGPRGSRPTWTPPGSGRDRPLSVAELNRKARFSLEDHVGEVWVEGEVSGFKAWSSGHWYFGLKDGRATVDAAMFSRDNKFCREKPADGQQVLVRGRASIFEARGRYQLVVEHLESAGRGALWARLDALRRRVEEEGLLDAARKRPLPAWPRRIGVVTSRQGAAFQDICKVLRSRHAQLAVVLSPCRVTGPESAPDVARAIERLARRDDLDAVIVGRGGGSLEDLWAFNEEKVVRAIAASSVPIISAVGHETDSTLADQVADLRAATPTQAAELICAPQAETGRRLATLLERLQRETTTRLSQARVRLDRGQPMRLASVLLREQDSRRQSRDLALERIVRAAPVRIAAERQRFEGLRRRLQAQRPDQRLRARREGLADRLRRGELALLSGLVQRWSRLEELQQRLQRAGAALAEPRRARVRQLDRALAALSPLAVLRRGHAILRREDGRIIRAHDEVAAGDVLTALLASGRLRLVVRDTLPPKE